MAWALVLALCTQVPEGAKAQACRINGPSINSTIGQQVANKNANNNGLCQFRQQEVVDVSPEDVGNKQQFVITKDLPGQGNMENYFMVRTGIFDASADKRDGSSAYYNKIEQNYAGQIYVSDITEYLADQIPKFKVSRGKTETGLEINEEYSTAGKILFAYGTYQDFLDIWAPWAGAD